MTRRKRNSGLGTRTGMANMASDVLDASGDVFDDAVDDAAYVADDVAGVAEVAAVGGR